MLDKAIAHGKEHRKPYYNSGRFDRTCRCHGGCPWCMGNRYHKHRVRIEATEQELKEVKYDFSGF